MGEKRTLVCPLCGEGVLSESDLAVTFKCMSSVSHDGEILGESLFCIQNRMGVLRARLVSKTNEVMGANFTVPGSGREPGWYRPDGFFCGPILRDEVAPMDHIYYLWVSPAVQISSRNSLELENTLRLSGYTLLG